MKWTEITCPDRVYGIYDDTEMIARGWFLHSIGVDLENLPEELFEPCELFNADNINKSMPYEAKVNIWEIVGTTHKTYGGKTWVYAFLQEHKTLGHIRNGSVTRGKYFRMLKRPLDEQPPCIVLLKRKNGKYYVYKNGNHRVTFYKLMYLSDLSNQSHKLHHYWLYAKVYGEI